MRTLTVACAAVFLAACGGGGSENGHVCAGAITEPPDLPADYAPGFADTWCGTGTFTADGESDSEVGPLGITTEGKNKLNLRDVCGSGVPALAASDSHFDSVCFACPSFGVEGCSSMVVTFESGYGDVDPGTGLLAIHLVGSAKGCGYDFDVSFDFSMMRQGLGCVSVAWDGAPGRLTEAVLARAAAQASR